MERLALGPNGAMVYCIEFLEKRLSWLDEKLDALPPVRWSVHHDAGPLMKMTPSGPMSSSTFPGKSSCLHTTPASSGFCSISSVATIGYGMALAALLACTCACITLIVRWQLAAVHLVDALYCCDANKFIAVVLTSLAPMMRLGLPHVNVLSKVDLLKGSSDLGALTPGTGPSVDGKELMVLAGQSSISSFSPVSRISRDLHRACKCALRDLKCHTMLTRC
jgi:GPN-loop GTPase